MDKKSIKIEYFEFQSKDELSLDDRELLDAAINAINGSYAPYSGFHVGAALRLSDGKIIIGSNQENAAYPSGLCAERTVMFSASAQYPEHTFDTLAIVASKEKGKLTYTPTSPCGACRQVMAEYQTHFKHNIRVILGSESVIRIFNDIDSLLPFIFDNL